MLHEIYPLNLSANQNGIAFQVHWKIRACYATTVSYFSGMFFLTQLGIRLRVPGQNI